jgi:hypothetical protein
MSERPEIIWKAQPEEEDVVNVDHFVTRRTVELSSGTRSEILTSVAAAVLFAAVMAWRLGPLHDRVVTIGVVAVAAWAVVSLVWFRRAIWRPTSAPPDPAAPGLEYYRKELERRRDHLKNEWVWHGPLVLACAVLVAVVMGRSFLGTERVVSAVPLVVLLGAWAAFGLWRRLRLAKQLQREIDEIADL